MVKVMRARTLILFSRGITITLCAVLVFFMFPLPKVAIAAFQVNFGQPTPNLDLTLAINGTPVSASSTVNLPIGRNLPVSISVSMKSGDNSILDGSQNSYTYWDSFYLDFYKGTAFSGATFISGEQMNATSSTLKSTSTVTFLGPGTYSAVLYDSGNIRDYFAMCPTAASCSPQTPLSQIRSNIETWPDLGAQQLNPLGIVTFTILPSDPCAAPGACISNVLFLPGIEGSTLFDEAASKEVWLPANDETADDLRLNSDGTSVNSDITASGIIDQTGVSQGYHVVYKDLLQEMQDWQTKYHIIATSTPYDWRLGYDALLTNGRKLPDGHISYIQAPVAGHDPYIIETLKQLASTSPTGKVTIIAHSNGGLLAKALMQKLGATTTAALIDNVILVASPQLGTPYAVEALLHGTGLGIPNADSDEKARDLAQNMPMSYLLLPSSQYFTYVDNPVVTISSSTLPSWASQYGSIIHWAQGLYNFMADSAHTRAAPTYSDLVNPQIVNSNLLAQAQVAHASLDNWTPPAGVHLYTIAGWGNETLSGIDYLRLPEQTDTCAHYTSNSTCAYYETAMSTTTKPRVVIDGDGTVVTPSALWVGGANSTRYLVDLNDYNGWAVHNSKIADILFGTHHDNIFNVPGLQNLLSSIISTSTINSLPQYISTSTPTYTGDMARLHFILHSPLTLGFIDAQGDYTGATATTTTFNIPGVNYERYGDVQWLSVPKSLAGTVVMHGTGTGSFALDIEEQQGNTVVATTTFAAIPSATSTIASLAIDPSIDPTASSTLVVDYSGDGAHHVTYEAKQGEIVLPDFTPPEAIIGFSTTTQQIEITGIDETSTTTVASTATSTTITDASSNWLTINIAGNSGRDDAHKELQHLPHLGNNSWYREMHSIAFDFNTHLPMLPAWRIPSRDDQDSSQHSDNPSPWGSNQIPFGPGTSTFAIRSLSYSTGTTTNEATSLRYFWNTNRSGKYTTFISSIYTPTDRIITIYVPHFDKTYIISATKRDDDIDLSTRFTDLLKRRHVKTYNGLYIPSVTTKQGDVQVNY